MIGNMQPAFITDRPTIRARERRAVIAGMLMAICIGSWGYALTPAVAIEQSVAHPIPRAIFQVGEYVCQKNDGLVSVEAYPDRGETFGVRCQDGAEFRDVHMRIRP